MEGRGRCRNRARHRRGMQEQGEAQERDAGTGRGEGYRGYPEPIGHGPSIEGTPLRYRFTRLTVDSNL